MFNYTRTGISLLAASSLDPTDTEGFFIIIKTSVAQAFDNLRVVVGIKFS